LYGGILGGMGVGLGGTAFALSIALLHSGLIGIASLAGLLGVSYGLARTIYVSVARSREHELRRLVERMAELLS
jgi:hypothetical protein